MVVKRTRKGRFTFPLSYGLREKIFTALINFLEDEGMRMRLTQLTHEDGILHHLYYTTLNELLTSRDFCLITAQDIKWTITRSHAIALMWLLRHYDDDMVMLELKSELHKMLQP